MELSDEDLKDFVRSGAKLRVVSSGRPEKEEPEKPSDAAQIVSALAELGNKLTELANREAPSVEVAAPQVSVHPKVNVEAPKTPKKWRVTVEERDRSADQRIKSLTIEAID